MDNLSVLRIPYL